MTQVSTPMPRCRGLKLGEGVAVWVAVGGQYPHASM